MQHEYLPFVAVIVHFSLNCGQFCCASLCLFTTNSTAGSYSWKHSHCLCSQFKVQGYLFVILQHGMAQQTLYSLYVTQGKSVVNGGAQSLSLTKEAVLLSGFIKALQ